MSSKVGRGGGGGESEGGGAAGAPLDPPAVAGEEQSKADPAPAAEQEPGAGIMAEGPCWSSSWIPRAHGYAPGCSNVGKQSQHRGAVLG